MKRKPIIFILSALLSWNSFSQNFYDVDNIREIKLYFTQPNWDHLLDSLYLDGLEERLLASVEIDGSMYDSIGVRYKGFSSVSINTVKNPFNIKLDYIDNNQNHEGFEKIKLSNVIKDPSFLREVLSYEIARDYIPSPRANFANVYVNDSLWGLYVNVEAINDKFTNKHFSTVNSPLFKCNPSGLNLQPSGNRLPKYTGGLGSRVTWGGFYADANFYFSGGNKIFERWNWYSQSTGLLSTRYYQGAASLMDRWQKPGDVTNVPRMRYSTSTSATGSGTSTRFLYDGDYVRLRDLVIGYNVSNKAVESLGFDSIQVNVKGTNLWTWVKDDELQTDPEVAFSGQWEIYTPILKSISLGLNLKF